MSTPEAMRVVVAGGGVAGLEALLALRRLAGDRVELELVSAGDTLAYRPLATLEPFRPGALRRFPLARLAEQAGARRHTDAVVAVDPWARTVTLASRGSLGYDALVLAVGADPVPAVPGAITFGGERSVGEVRAALGSLERGETRRVAVVVPPGLPWSLPAYELALLTAGWARERRLAVDVLLVTAESEPLAALGPRAAARVAERLEAAGVGLAAGWIAESYESGRLWMGIEGSFATDHAIALPRWRGRVVVVVPHDGDGFIAVDEHARVRGLDHVYAAGDVTDEPVKHGGLAARQADAAAAAIAAAAGAEVAPAPFSRTLQATLLTGGVPTYLEAALDEDGRGEAEVADEPLWWRGTKVAAAELGPLLAALEAEEPSQAER